ncbi:hypothetical protein ACJIZ3_007554 [Penstemon smallii]|uniref:S-adenosyl-L-methionine-dependent methyltransferase n=1 Tax=Penstemon smallii TaxID=265156 RepID=A0ABD3T974_9LAMI
MIKQEAPPLHHRKRQLVANIPVNKYTKSIASFIILLSFYFLGYFTAPVVVVQPQQINTIQQSTNPPAVVDHNRFSTQCVNPVAPQLVRKTILDRVFNGTSPWLNFPPAHVIPLLRPRRIKGWGSNGAVFETLIREVRPKTIIEVGTFLGASALHMSELTHQLGLNETQILCIDDFRGWPGFKDKFLKDLAMVNGDVLLLQQFMQNVVHEKATESILFMPFSTSSALEKLCEWGVFGDLIEVDAGHDFHSAWSDINKAYKILRPPGGVIFGHDYFTSADNKGVRRAVNLFAKLNNLRVQTHGQHWVIHPAADTT